MKITEDAGKDVGNVRMEEMKSIETSKQVSRRRHIIVSIIVTGLVVATLLGCLLHYAVCKSTSVPTDANAGKDGANVPGKIGKPIDGRVEEEPAEFDSPAFAAERAQMLPVHIAWKDNSSYLHAVIQIALADELTMRVLAEHERLFWLYYKALCEDYSPTDSLIGSFGDLKDAALEYLKSDQTDAERYKQIQASLRSQFLENYHGRVLRAKDNDMLKSVKSGLFVFLMLPRLQKVFALKDEEAKRRVLDDTLRDTIDEMYASAACFADRELGQFGYTTFFSMKFYELLHCLTLRDIRCKTPEVPAAKDYRRVFNGFSSLAVYKDIYNDLPDIEFAEKLYRRHFVNLVKMIEEEACAGFAHHLPGYFDAHVFYKGWWYCLDDLHRTTRKLTKEQVIKEITEEYTKAVSSNAMNTTGYESRKLATKPKSR